MNLLLLPGNSQRNRMWLQHVEDSLAPGFERTQRHSYAHWERDEPEIDLDVEIERLATIATNFLPYVVFAKSAGTILACVAASKRVLKPQACLFVGFPLAMAANQDLPVAEWLHATTFPITILQHSADPLGTYEAVTKYFDGIKRSDVTVHELPGDTHDYLEFQTFKAFASKMLQYRFTPDH